MWVVLWCLLAASAAPAQATPLFDEQLYESVLQPELCATQLSEMLSFEFFSPAEGQFDDNSLCQSKTTTIYNIGLVYDASFRVPHSIMMGNQVHFGDYFQCLGISQEASNGPIEGKYCMITVPASELELLPGPWPDLPNLPDLPWFPDTALQIEKVTSAARFMAGIADQPTSKSGMDSIAMLGSFRLAVCIPKSCSVDQALQSYFDNSFVRVNYTTQHCRLPGDRPFAPADYVAIGIFSFIGLVTLLSTSYELRHLFILRRNPKQLNELYSCCSLYRNTRRLFTFRDSPDAISCLDGIRSLSILWVIVGHTMENTLVSLNITNLVDAITFFNDPASIWVKAAYMAVDTFLMLSGLLVVYTSANKMTSWDFLRKLHVFYLNRLLRIFPVLATAVLMMASLFHHVADGANWHFLAQYVGACRQNWWPALLHIQNYYNPRDECLPHSWYLSVDVQLYILCPLVLFWVLRGRSQGWAAVSIALLATLAASTTYVFINDFPTNLWSSGFLEYWKGYYVNILTRAPVFLVGMFVGFLFHDCRNRKVELTLLEVIAGWTGALATLGAVLYSFQIGSQLTSQPTSLQAGMINSFTRAAWGAGLGWVAFASAHGYGGPINWFLSLTIWKFIARISYAMYIFHYPMQFIKQASIIAPLYFSVPNALLSFVNDLNMTIFVSVVVCIFIDAPFGTLQKTLLGGGARKPAAANSAPTGTQRAPSTTDVIVEKTKI